MEDSSERVVKIEGEILGWELRDNRILYNFASKKLQKIANFFKIFETLPL